MNLKKLKIGLPKGSLQESTVRLFKKAGFIVTISGRSYYPTIDDDELEAMLIRAQEMAIYVQKGILDTGLTGKDWIVECGADVVEVAELNYAKEGLKPVKWVIAVPNDSEIKEIEDLEGKRVSTELVSVTKGFLREAGVKAEVEFSWGATEVKPPELADAIVELTETGRSLKAHNLRVIGTILQSTTRLIANKKSWEDPWKREKIENLACLLQGAIQAETKVGLKMNVLKIKLDKIMALLPAIQAPTISNLCDENWMAVEVIIDEKIVRDLIPELKKAEATGIVEYPLNKVIY
ncbi:MAG: ATP phosphoribosyltransferase [bacterium]